MTKGNQLAVKDLEYKITTKQKGDIMEKNLEIRKYACGCVDSHDSALWSSTSVDHCKDHAFREDGSFTERDENPAACEGIAYVVE